MKTPRSPKSIERLLAENSNDIPAVLAANLQPTISRGRYIHWDQLQHRPPPEGLSREQWWLGIKIVRKQMSQEIPIPYKTGEPFVYMLPDIVQEALHHIDSQARGSIAFPESFEEPESRTRFVVSALRQEAIASSQFEGANTTREVAVRMLRSGRRPKDPSERMIVNNYQAMQSVRQIKDKPMTRGTLLELHKTLTSDTLEDPNDAGRIQQPGEKRVFVWNSVRAEKVHEPPPAVELEAHLDAMIRFANAEGEKRFIHPVIRAIILHFWLAYAHPFVDGNGRATRALFYWAMLRAGYWVIEYLPITRQLQKAPTGYYRAFLHTETDGNDLTYFIVHQVQIILQALSDFAEYVKAKAEQVREVEQMLKQAGGLNHRQLALLAHAIRNSDEAYTFRSHQASHRVAYATARADLLQLTRLELLKRQKVGQRAYVFYPMDDLEKRICGLAKAGVKSAGPLPATKPDGQIL